MSRRGRCGRTCGSSSAPCRSWWAAVAARSDVDPLANPQELIRRVYAYAAYRLGPGADAEDITSETFARALRYRESFDEKRGDALPWLIGIARRCIAGLQE